MTEIEIGLVIGHETEIGPTEIGHVIKTGLRSVLDPRIAIEIATEDEMIMLKN